MLQSSNSALLVAALLSVAAAPVANATPDQAQILNQTAWAAPSLGAALAPPVKLAAASHSKEEAVVVPATVEQLLAAVDQRVAVLDQVIAAGELAKVHTEAFAARDLLAALPSKLKTLDKAKAQALDAALARIRQQAVLLDKFGDAGDAAQTRAVFARFKNEIAAIRQQVADKPST